MTKPTFSGELNSVFTAHGREYLSRMPEDNFYEGNPTLSMMRRVSRKRTGSKFIMEPLLEGGEPLGGSFTRTQALSTDSSDPVTEATYEWAHYAEPIAIFWQDEFHAGGAGALFNYIEMRIQDARLKLERKLSTDLFAATPAAGALSSLPQVTGLTTTFGQLSPSTYTWWAPKNIDTIVFPTVGLDRMRTMANNVTAGGLKRHDFVVTSQTLWESYVDLAEAKHTIDTGASSGAGRLADLGFPVAMYQGKPLIWDTNCPVDAMYFVNNTAVQLVESYGGPYQLTPFQSMNVNGQQGRIAYLRWSGQMTARNRRCLGSITTATLT
jgi:hypothetical protein